MTGSEKTAGAKEEKHNKAASQYCPLFIECKNYDIKTYSLI